MSIHISSPFARYDKIFEHDARKFFILSFCFVPLNFKVKNIH